MSLRTLLIALFGIAVQVDAEAKEPINGDADRLFGPISSDPAGKPYFSFPAGRWAWYTAHLSAMREPSLHGTKFSRDDFVLRFTWVRSFHAPVAIRLTAVGGKVETRAVRLKWINTETLGAIDVDTSPAIKRQDLAEVAKHLAHQGFWKPLNEDEKSAFATIRDGAGWLFEKVDKDGYAMVGLLTPSFFFENAEPWKDLKLRDFRPYYALGLQLLKITSLLPQDASDIY